MGLVGQTPFHGGEPRGDERYAKGAAFWFRNVVPPGQARWRPQALILQKAPNNGIAAHTAVRRPPAFKF
jgi:hypothetical protein